MAINTSRSLEKTSTVLGRKCEQTQKNMTRLMAEAGCAGGKMKEVLLPVIPGSRDDVVFVGLNGAKFYFMRGVKAAMPEAVYEILRNTKTLE